MFLGDTLTAKADKSEIGYLTILKEELTHSHPGFEIEFINAGVLLDKVPDAQKRLQKDVLDLKPSVVFIQLGLFDVWCFAGRQQSQTGTPKEEYAAGLKDLILRSRAAGAHVILCTPGIIGEKTDGSNSILTLKRQQFPIDAIAEEYVKISRKAAAENDAQLLDMHKAMRDYIKTCNPGNVPQGILTLDGTTLSVDGSRMLAGLILKTLQPMLPPLPQNP